MVLQVEERREEPGQHEFTGCMRRMASLDDKLSRLLAAKGLMRGAEWKAKAAEMQERRAAGEFEIDRVVSGERVGDDESGFYLVRTDFPLDAPHGPLPLGAVLEADANHVSLSANDEELEDFDPATAVFVDTETTGLVGGTGTVTFLVGVGYFEGGVFRLDQCFMRDYDDEDAMLAFLAERFAQAETLVSFNGKSFDLPLLRTRFITNRVPCRLDGMMHFDLVHAARRFWKLRLRDCSLGNIEREILGVRRHGDVDSSRIPQLWLDYLHTRDARPLAPVFYHHKMDILSLVTLTAMLSNVLAVPEGKGFEHHEDRLSLVRVHFRGRRYEDVLRVGNAMLDSLSDESLRRACLEMMGHAAKRLGRWEEMEAAWTALMQEFPRDLVARAELAKHYEHRKRDLAAARCLCEETVQLLETHRALYAMTDAAWRIEAFRRRLQRIERKLGRSFGDIAGE